MYFLGKIARICNQGYELLHCFGVSILNIHHGLNRPNGCRILPRMVLDHTLPCLRTAMHERRRSKLEACSELAEQCLMACSMVVIHCHMIGADGTTQKKTSRPCMDHCIFFSLPWDKMLRMTNPRGSTLLFFLMKKIERVFYSEACICLIKRA